MNRYRTSRCLLFLTLLICCLSFLTGCSVATGNMLTFFPQREALTKEAKNARWVSASQGMQPIARELNQSVIPAYIVQPGDGLFVQPADLDSKVTLISDQTVLADGTIHLGKYGQVRVAGKTVPEIESLVESTVNAFHKEEMGAMVVRVLVPDSLVYYVLGEVNSPGAFPLKGRENVLDGILVAGGLTARASHKSIILSRPTPPNGCRVVLPVCYNHIVQLGDTSTNFQLRPGDRIYVPSRTLTEDIFPHRFQEVCNNPQIPCIGCGECSNCEQSALPVVEQLSTTPSPIYSTPSQQQGRGGPSGRAP